MSHPWSTDVDAQAAIRAAEGDRGPTLSHRDVPEAVEALRKCLDSFIEDELYWHEVMSERVGKLEMDALMDVQKDRAVERLAERVARLEAAAARNDYAAAKAVTGESEAIKRLTAERDAAMASVRKFEAAWEPVAWGIMRVGGGWVTVLDSAVQAETSREYWDKSENWVHQIVPLYTAPQQERVRWEVAE